MAASSDPTPPASPKPVRRPRTSFLGELQRRHVPRVGLLYLAVSWLLLQVADILLPVFDAPAWAMRALVVLLAVGLPLVIAFAWAFELTAEGLQRDVTWADTPGPWFSGNVGLITGGMLLLAASLFAFSLVTQRNARQETPDAIGAAAAVPALSVAVLPFVNDGPEPGKQYFADGIAEELLNLLAGIPELRVVARTSSFRFRDADLDVTEIGRRLGVRHVVEGMARHDNDRIRISAQLIDTRTGFHVWSHVYEARLDDIFEVQSDIARRIAQQLELVMTPAVTRRLEVDAPTSSAQLFDQYLLARHLFLARADTAEQSVLRSIELLEEIVAADPAYARAWATLSAAYAVAAGVPEVDHERYAHRAVHAAGEALRLDPRLAEAHATLGFMHADRFEWGRGLDAFERAVALEPGDVTARLWYAITLAAVGWLDAAVEQARIAADADPLSAMVHSWLSYLSWVNGHVEEAEAAASRAADLGMLPYTEFHLALARGDDDQAIAAWEAFWRHSNVDPSFVRPLVAAVRDPSRRDDALAVVRALEDRADPGQPGNSIAHRLAPYLRLGAVDAALDELEMRLAQGPHRRFVLLSMLWEPDARAVRASRRFAVFADDVGLVGFWHQRGWPGFCEPAGAALVCRH